MIGLEELELKENSVYILFCNPNDIDIEKLAESVAPPNGTSVMLVPSRDGRRPDTLEGIQNIKDWIAAIEEQSK